jgi:hypothetical protein
VHLPSSEFAGARGDKEGLQGPETTILGPAPARLRGAGDAVERPMGRLASEIMPFSRESLKQPPVQFCRCSFHAKWGNSRIQLAEYNAIEMIKIL